MVNRLKSLLFISLFGLIACMTSRADQAFKMPPLDRKYNEVAWWVAHNAPFSSEDGYIYYNQNLNLMDQYKAGARGFELDLEWRCRNTFGPFGDEECDIRLCHESCEVNKFLQPSIGGLFQATGDPNGFKDYALKIIKEILTKDSQAILTITLENRVRDHRLIDKEIEEAGLADFVLKPGDWNPLEKQGWPTLEWMIKNNKRLVIFNDRGVPEDQQGLFSPLASSKYAYYQWQAMTQNQWGGANNFETARKERGSSAGQYTMRYLYEFDWFPDGGKIIGGISNIIAAVGDLFKKETPFAGDMNKVNCQDLEQALDKIIKEGLTTGKAKDRYPNFIKVDFGEKGCVNTIVNRINEMANDPVKRAKMFAPIRY